MVKMFGAYEWERYQGGEMKQVGERSVDGMAHTIRYCILWVGEGYRSVTDCEFCRWMVPLAEEFARVRE